MLQYREAARERGIGDREAFEETFANPGIQELFAAVGEDSRARRAIEATYAWIREHTECPQIDPHHLETMLRAGERDQGKRAARWRKDFAKSDKSKKLLFKDVPREHRDLAAVLLKTIEEIETGAHKPATPEQIELATRILTLEKARFTLENTDPEDVTEETLELLLAEATPGWTVRPEKHWTLERRGLREAEGPEHFTISQTLASYCFDKGGGALAEIEVDQGEIEKDGARGMAVRLKALRFAYEGGRRRLGLAALAIEKHLALHGFTEAETAQGE